MSALEMGTTVDLVPANQSFKLASEVALMIVFLFQCYPRRLQEHASLLLPLMVKACLHIVVQVLHHDHDRGRSDFL
jgi:hypothetical protein